MKRVCETVLTVAVLTSVAGATNFSQVAASTKADAILRQLTGSVGGSVTLAEANAAARRKFVALDLDRDRLLSRDEAAPTMSRPAFARDDTDRDGYVDIREYLAAVQRRFYAADIDRDGVLNAGDLESSQGARLISLL